MSLEIKPDSSSPLHSSSHFFFLVTVLCFPLVPQLSSRAKMHSIRWHNEPFRPRLQSMGRRDPSLPAESMVTLYSTDIFSSPLHSTLFPRSTRCGKCRGQFCVLDEYRKTASLIGQFRMVEESSANEKKGEQEVKKRTDQSGAIRKMTGSFSNIVRLVVPGRLQLFIKNVQSATIFYFLIQRCIRADRKRK